MSLETRWLIRGELRTRSRLHVGSADPTDRPAPLNPDGRPVEVAAVATDAFNRAYIPGRALKGSLRSWCERRVAEPEMLDQVFGFERGEDEGAGGKVEVCDALSTGDLPEFDSAYWDPDRLTVLEASTAVDGHLGSALDETLRHVEYVPPGVAFAVELCGAGLSNSEVALLLRALEGFDDEDDPVCLGAGTLGEPGKLNWDREKVRIWKLDATGAARWLASEDPPTGYESVAQYGHDVTAELAALARSEITVEKPNGIWLTFKVTFDDPFSSLVQSPDKPDERLPRTSADGKPLLPDSSWRGALRARAAAIARTLGLRACSGDPGSTGDAAACAVEESADAAEICVVCRLFGAVGWGRRVRPSDLVGIPGTFKPSKRQHRIAVDRFTGGVAGAKKFEIEYFPAGSLKGQIFIAHDLSATDLGLLALTLKDFLQGDVALGHGGAIGLGCCRAVLETASWRLPPGHDLLGLGLDASGEWRRAGTAGHEGLGKVLEPCVERLRSAARKAASTAAGSQPEKGEAPQGSREELPGASGADRSAERFHPPYHFVPALPAGSTVDCAATDIESGGISHVTHSSFVAATPNGEEVYSGRIACRLTNEAPLVLGAERNEPEGDQPAEVSLFELEEGRPALPGSSLRGLVSALAEAASNSALRVLENDRYSIRSPARQGLSQLGRLEVAEGKLALRPLGAKARLPNKLPKGLRVSHSATHPEFAYLKKDGSEVIDQSECDDRPGTDRSQYDKGVVRLFESPPGQKPRFFKSGFYPVTGEEPLEVTDALEKFLDLAWLQHQRGSFLRLKGAKNPSGEKREDFVLEEGDLLFYRADGDRAVEVSISSIWRHDKGKVWDYFAEISGELLPFNPDRQTVSIAEAMFGFAGAQRGSGGFNLKSRVRFSFGHLAADAKVRCQDRVPLKELSSPKPPAPALYFKTKAKKAPPIFISKAALRKSEHVPQGRKFYLHQPVQKEGWKSLRRPPTKRQAYGTPLEDGHVFYFHVDFHNLSRSELALLCFSLRPWEGFRHKLGMGKPIGLGTVRIDPIGLYFVDRWERYGSAQLMAQEFFGGGWTAENENGRPWPREAAVPAAIAELGSKPAFDDLRREFWTKVPKDVLRALELLGDATGKYSQYEIEYPSMIGESGPDKEEEGYQWFVANERAEGQALGPLGVDRGVLPSLKRYPGSSKRGKKPKRR